MSTLESPWLFGGLFESLEQSALPRTKATPSESDAAESGTRKRGKTKCKDTKTQVHDVKVSDMLMMKPPKLWNGA